MSAPGDAPCVAENPNTATVFKWDRVSCIGPVVARLDQQQDSSDGGAILLKATDRRYGLIAGLASSLQDERQAGKIEHTLKELLAQRDTEQLARR